MGPAPAPALAPAAPLPGPRPWISMVASAGLMVLAYPPFHLVLPSFVALVPLYWLLERALATGRRRALAHAAAYGTGCGVLAHAALLWWMLPALTHYTGHPMLMFLLAVLVLGLWWGLFGWWVAWVWRRAPAVPRWLPFAAGWTALEWAIGHQGPLAFPWLGLGTSLTAVPIVVQWADLAGARGVTFWLAAVNAVLARVLERPRRHLGPAIAVGVSVVVAVGYGAVRPATLTLQPVGRVAFVQPALSIEAVGDAEARGASIDTLLERSREVARSRPAVIVWPEGALGGHESARWRERVRALVERSQVPMVVGVLERQPESNALRNTAWHVAAGSASDSYRKRRLVPLVEGGTAPGQAAPLFVLGAEPFGVLICFEVAFEDLARRYRRAGAAVIVNISNDAWGLGTPARFQHAAHMTMRAIETRATVARAANLGISGVVLPDGSEVTVDGVRGATTLVAPLVITGRIPPYVVLGDWVALLSGVLVLGLTAVGVSRRGGGGVAVLS